MNADIAPELLAGTRIFSDLGLEVIRAIVQQSRVIKLQDNEALFRAGDPYQSELYVLYLGELVLHRASGEILRQGPGSIYGLANYLDHNPYTSTAISDGASVVLALHADALAELERRYPPLSDALNRIITERLRNRSRLRQRVSGHLAQPVRHAMKSPMATCGTDLNLREAHQIMRQRKIGSLGVVSDSGALLGLLTFPGLSEATLLKNAGPEDSVLDVACEMPISVSPDTMLWQADDIQRRHAVKYLVVEEDGKPVGILSQSDLLSSLVAQQTAILTGLKEATTVETLRTCRARIPQIGRQAWENNRRASNAVRCLSDMHIAIQRRCVELTLEDMQQQGHGAAPRAFALLIMGSGGRREMMLDPDQDNGLIIEDAAGPLSAGETRWFARFAGALNDNFATVGYRLCPGDIMARNPTYHKTLGEWQAQIRHLLRHPSEKAARWSNIVFDFDTLYGDDGLTSALRKTLLTSLQQENKLLAFMAEDDAEGQPAIGWFNRLITADDKNRKGRIDIKRNGSRIICDAARIFALSAGVTSCNTYDRLDSLVHQGTLSADLVESVITAYDELMDLLLSHQLDCDERGQPIDNLIDPDMLSGQGKEALRMAMRAIKRLQDILQGRFGLSNF